LASLVISLAAREPGVGVAPVEFAARLEAARFEAIMFEAVTFEAVRLEVARFELLDGTLLASMSVSVAASVTELVG
jgi:hypothetical protein